MSELIKTLLSAVFLALMVIGIGGLSWSAFQEGGWVERAFDVIWEGEVRHPLLLIPTIGGALLMASVFLRGGLRPGQSSIITNCFIYTMAACGLYYIYRWYMA